MIIEFTVGNYRSFKDRKTLSLEATSISDYPENVFEAGRYKLLKSIVLFGANASGKTNFLNAMSKMADLVLQSFGNPSVKALDIEPFLLNTETIHAPTFFEIVFLIDDMTYRYGFELTKKEIISEWLFEAKKTKEKSLFLRMKDGIDTSRFDEGKNLEKQTGDNVLFLSVVHAFKGELAGKIVNKFSSFASFEEDRDAAFIERNKLLNSEADSAAFRSFLSHFKVGLGYIRIEDEGMLNAAEQNTMYRTVHKVMDAEGNIVGTTELDLDKHSSAGTNKIFDLSSKIFNHLKYGTTMIVDELDAKLHSLMTLNLIYLFRSEAYNPMNAQLIFSTHNTNLLNSGKFRRDQVYLLDKDRFQASDLYSLVEFKLSKTGAKVRKDNSFEKDYLEGRYGAIPFIGEFIKS